MQLYIEILIIYDGPYQPSSIMECRTGFERRSYGCGKMVVAHHLLWALFFLREGKWRLW